MSGRKEYELLMKLTAALGSGFNSTFSNANNTVKKLQDSLQNIQKVQKNIEGYKKTQDAIAATKDSVQELGQKHTDLQQKLAATVTREKELQKALEKSKKATGTETEEYIRLETALAKTQTQKEKLTGQIKNNENATQKATRQIGEEENKLADLTKELQTAGVNTNKLTQENEKLEKTYEQVKKSQENFARANSELEKNKQAISATKTELLKTVGATTALGAALYVPVKGAMEFESSMAEVAKVVDWIGNGNNATAEQIQQYNELSDSLYGLTRQIPMTAKEFAEITAAAGQANVAMDNAGLLKFAEDAAKMGIAFDISAEQAGQFMAQWRTAFGMAQSEVVELSDVINYLGNTTPATAAQISNVVTRIGPLGEVAGLTSKDLAALGAAIVGVGIDESVAATGIKNLMLDMTKGTAATKKMHGVLESLGTSATDLAERMQTDATGAIMDFMRAVKQLPEAEQAAALTTYFGQESVAAIAPLLSNLNNLEAQFNKVGDASQYAGSMEAEYAARAATSENTVQLMKNAIKELSDTFGSVFVPNAASGAQALTEVIYKVTDFVKENGETIKTVTAVVAALLAAKTAYLGIKTVVLSVTGVYKGIKVAMAAYQVAQVAAAAGTSIWTVESGAAATSTWALAGAFLAATWPVLAIVAAVAAVIAIVILLVKHWDTVKEVAGTVWEAIKNTFGKIAEFFSNAMQPIIDALSPIIQKIGEIFSTIWQIIVAVFGVLATWFNDNVILPVIEFFKPIVEAIGGVFQKAWEAVKEAFGKAAEFFGGVWDSIVAIFTPIGTAIGEAVSGAFKSVVNAILTFAENRVNGFIAGINTVVGIVNSLPGVNISTISPLAIPKLEKGSNYTPDTFIAGDVNGKGGELITGARGRKVFTAAETNAIFDNINRAKEINNTMPTARHDAPPVMPMIAERVGSFISALKGTAANRASELSGQPIPAMPNTHGSGGVNFIYSPTIHAGGNGADNMEEIKQLLKEHGEEMLLKFKEFLRQQREDERRMNYA